MAKKNNLVTKVQIEDDVLDQMLSHAVAASTDQTSALAAIDAMPPAPKEPQDYVRSIDLAEKAYALRLAGYTPSEIAHDLTLQLKRKVTVQEVDDMTEAVAANNIRRTNDQIASTFQLELDRLDRAMKAIFPAVCDGNLQAIDRMDKLQTRRAKMLGLDAPDVRASVTVNSEGLDLTVLSREELAAYKELYLKARSAKTTKLIG